MTYYFFHISTSLYCYIPLTCNVTSCESDLITTHYATILRDVNSLAKKPSCFFLIIGCGVFEPYRDFKGKFIVSL